MGAALRRQLTAATGVDHSAYSTNEILDAVNYLVFPNLMPWAGYGVPIVYRLRPYRDDPNKSILEVYLLFVVPDGRPESDVVPTHWLKPGELWSSAPELGGLGPIFDQDERNFAIIQQGLRAGGNPELTVSAYQESRIRHLHDTIDAYIQSGERS